jgi:rod shape-determining protein MreC
MVGLALLLTIAGSAGVLNPFQGAFLKVTAPLDNAFTAVFRPIATFLSDAGSLNGLQDENAKLRVENEELRNKVVSLQQDAERVKELEEALKITQGAGSDVRLAASIVHKDTSPFTDVVSINRGSSSGVKAGMVVLSAQGSLIGTVTKTFDDQAFVRLITDSKSKVNAQVLESKSDGIVRGNPGRTLTFDLAQADIKVGDRVVTSGLGGNYPPGLPIGTVKDVSGTPQDLFRTVKVEPMVRLSTAQTVLVLTSFLPQRLGLESQ